MGWKNIKEAFQIKHHVQVVADKGICIGSGYIHDLIVIGLDGSLKKRYTDRSNDELERYQSELDIASKGGWLKELIDKPDAFDKSITVYTYSIDGGEILEKQCEELGWPNVTHDGDMMYENTFSTDRNQVIKWAQRNADAWVKHFSESIASKKKEIEEAEAELEKALTVQARIAFEKKFAEAKPIEKVIADLEKEIANEAK